MEQLKKTMQKKNYCNFTFGSDQRKIMITGAV